MITRISSIANALVAFIFDTALFMVGFSFFALMTGHHWVALWVLVAGIAIDVAVTSSRIRDIRRDIRRSIYVER